MLQGEDDILGLDSPTRANLQPAPTGLGGDATLQDAVRDLILTYHDLNPSTVPVLTDPPSPLQFLRHIARNTPFVVRSGASDYAACRKWSATYLSTVMQDPTYTGPTHYAQTQNDNLRHEYETLFSDVPASIPWARLALANTSPDAINFWLGNSHSTTALHKDNYENVYVQVLGRKHFVLLPPVEAPCVGERAVLAATYAPRRRKIQEEGGSDGCDDDVASKEDLFLQIDSPEEYVPFATWDPDFPKVNATPYSHLARPLRVTLEEGDVLYLPALWYHKVSQSCNDEGVCCAVNYWYDLDFSGGFWSTANFVRSVGLLSMRGGDGEKEKGEEGEKEKGEEGGNDTEGSAKVE
ncbi:phospholipase A2 [Pyrenophora seminiperda CCB06]|uniref:Phospholipase A2 n=1 Tax=Pyrenophora seminiperda CCB06 TaxID=1302712 RepID=A0A3M7M876_9PLEO|nr:phospholipase A2 [Pyrenophora seminiperda CCB06]